MKDKKEKKKNCNIQLAYPKLRSGKTEQIEWCLPLTLKSSATKAEKYRSEALIFVG